MRVELKNIRMPDLPPEGKFDEAAFEANLVIDGKKIATISKDQGNAPIIYNFTNIGFGREFHEFLESHSETVVPDSGVDFVSHVKGLPTKYFRLSY